MKFLKKNELDNLSKSELVDSIINLQREIKSKKYGLVWDRERERESLLIVKLIFRFYNMILKKTLLMTKTVLIIS
jgi:hypothetical protein